MTAAKRANSIVTRLGGVPVAKPATDEILQALNDAGKLRPRHPSLVENYAARDIAFHKLRSLHVLGPTLIM